MIQLNIKELLNQVAKNASGQNRNRLTDTEMRLVIAVGKERKGLGVWGW